MKPKRKYNSLEEVLHPRVEYARMIKAAIYIEETM